ncbi:MAG: hypothetical protein ABIO04_14410 [Ferruginibacter sp.]
MKMFKQVDLWISCILIMSFTVAGLLKMDETFIIGYFVVGGWQVISMAIHAFNHWFTQRKGVRRIYHWITAISLLTMPAGSFWILLFTAPFMAMYYAWICYIEVYVKLQRPITLLKN